MPNVKWSGFEKKRYERLWQSWESLNLSPQEWPLCNSPVLVLVSYLSFILLSSTIAVQCHSQIIFGYAGRHYFSYVFSHVKSVLRLCCGVILQTTYACCHLLAPFRTALCILQVSFSRSSLIVDGAAAAMAYCCPWCFRLTLIFNRPMHTFCICSVRTLSLELWRRLPVAFHKPCGCGNRGITDPYENASCRSFTSD